MKSYEVLKRKRRTLKIQNPQKILYQLLQRRILLKYFINNSDKPNNSIQIGEDHLNGTENDTDVEIKCNCDDHLKTPEQNIIVNTSAKNLFEHVNFFYLSCLKEIVR